MLVVRSRHATVLVLLLVSAGCGVSRRPGSPPSSAGGALGAPLRVNVGSLRHPDIVTIDLEDYVRETVPAEIVVPPADDEFAEGVYQAQAIVARTYAVASRGRHAADGFDLCSTTHCQVFRRATAGADVPQDVADAVAATTSRVLAYDGRPIRAVFHAHCGGHTSDADVIWPGAPVPYLRGVPDPFCQRERDARWSFRISARDLTSALDRLPATRVDGRLDGLQIMERDPAGRVVLIALTGARSALIRGEDLRSAVIRAGGARSVRSPRYDISRRGDAFFFVGDGEGHGAGLCQSGMVGRIKAGHTPEEVLEYYYQGARVARLEQLSGT